MIILHLLFYLFGFVKSFLRVDDLSSFFNDET